MPQLDTGFFSSLIFWSIVSFTVLLAILYKFGLPAIVEILEQREQTIKNDLDRAEQARREAEVQLAEYERRLQQARAEVEAILDEARRKAQKNLEEQQRKVEQQTAGMIREAQEEIAREQGRLRESLRLETVALVITATEQVLARRLTSADDQRLIEETLASLEAASPASHR